MIRQRLYLQIYLTILAALALTVIVTSVVFSGFDKDDRPSKTASVLAQRAVAQALPPADAPPFEQSAILDQVAADLIIELAIYGADGRLIASRPDTAKFDLRGPDRRADNPLVLDDGRMIVARVPFPAAMGGVGVFLMVLGAIALAIGVAAYPLVRRMTGRLERLQDAVESIGDGDLTTRAVVEGQDEIAALAQSVNMSADRIEALVDAHRVLLANASHELRTPLSRIRVGLEIFRESGDQARLATIATDIGQLDTLIDEILTLSRLDAASIDMEADIDFLGLVAEECAQFGVAVQGQPTQVSGNRELLRRLVRNLVLNAQRHGEPPVEVHVTSQGKKATLIVRDAGIGIPPEEREKVFERFYRGAGKQNVEGYGLGLPLVRQIAEAHGGYVDVSDGAQSQITVRF